MTVPFHVIIPARYASSRFPGKLLYDLHGRTVLEHVYQQACKASPVSVIIAADHDAIFRAAENFGAHVVMTDVAHPSGTSRIAEIIARGNFNADDIIVNVQGDEPFIPSVLIQQVASLLARSDDPMATLCFPLDASQLHNPSVVKVVRNKAQRALYFSRQAIPFCRDNPASVNGVFRHIGLYAYRAQFLLDMVAWEACALEEIECLEQLRVLWEGYAIHVGVANVEPQQDINTFDDLQQAREKYAYVD